MGAGVGVGEEKIPLLQADGTKIKMTAIPTTKTGFFMNSSLLLKSSEIIPSNLDFFINGLRGAKGQGGIILFR